MNQIRTIRNASLNWRGRNRSSLTFSLCRPRCRAGGPMQILPKLAEWSCRFLAPPPPPKLIPSRHERERERERESGKEREWLPWLPIHPSIRLIKGAFFHLGNTLSTIGATEQNGRHGHIAVQIYHSRPKGLPTSNNKSYV